MRKRAIWIVLDSAGIGQMPDSALFGDAGADTLGNIYRARGLAIPNMFALGLSHIVGVKWGMRVIAPKGCFGKAAEKARAKDTTSGHWEMAGVIMEPPFRTFPDGFPPKIIKEFERRIKRKVLGNTVESGTEIIARLGAKHMRTKGPIVYTSADSVFQIAAHEDVIEPELLYEMCIEARELMMGEWAVGRVIARPFEGKPGSFARTPRRRDYALPPPSDTVLDALKKLRIPVAGVGKIEDIFCGQGISAVDHTTNNAAGIDATLRFMRSMQEGLIFTNLVDFDMLYGHRNNVEGYGRALEYFDARLLEILDALSENDLLIITADHGCDPTTPGTDHTREYAPILACGPRLRKNVDLGVRDTLADMGATVYEHLSGETFGVGRSFLGEMVF